LNKLTDEGMMLLPFFFENTGMLLAVALLVVAALWIFERGCLVALGPTKSTAKGETGRNKPRMI
jgi:Kef-type K+ transport system membrane component KefB